MTEHEWVMLGKRAVACKDWRWLPGMSLIRRKTGPAGGTGLRPTHLRVALTCGHPCDPFACVADVDRLPRPCPPDPHWVPDLRDPATVGCLLALVREAYGMPYLSLKMTTSIWRIERDGTPMEWLFPDLEYTGHFGTEAAALVDALEAARTRGAAP